MNCKPLKTIFTKTKKASPRSKKYLHDAGVFLIYLNGREVTKELTVAYKKRLASAYKAASVNAMLGGRQLLPCLHRACGLPREAASRPAGAVRGRKPGTDARGIRPPRQCRGGNADRLRHAGDLWHWHPRFRTAVYHRRGGAGGARCDTQQG